MSLERTRPTRPVLKVLLVGRSANARARFAVVVEPARGKGVRSLARARALPRFFFESRARFRFKNTFHLFPPLCEKDRSVSREMRPPCWPIRASRGRRNPRGRPPHRVACASLSLSLSRPGVVSAAFFFATRREGSGRRARDARGVHVEELHQLEPASALAA